MHVGAAWIAAIGLLTAVVLLAALPAAGKEKEGKGKGKGPTPEPDHEEARGCEDRVR
jgi:hypothetical protein